MYKLGDVIKGDKIGKRVGYRFVWTICPDCERQRWVRRSKSQLKSYTGLCQVCNGKRGRKTPTGDKHWKWKGGRKIEFGYVRVLLYSSDFFYPMAHNGYVAEHRLVMAKYLNRCLLPWESVHHKNGVKTDNRLENLELFPTSLKHNSITRWEAYIKQKEVIAFKAGMLEESTQAYTAGKYEGTLIGIKKVVEFIDWLDNGLRSSSSWRTEMRKFRQALKKEWGIDKEAKK